MFKPLLILLSLHLLAVVSFALDGAKLQIINGAPDPVEALLIAADGARVPEGEIEPGKARMISTTLGQRFVIVSRGDKSEMPVVSEVPVQAFRVGGVPAFYTQQASAGGFPIVASAK